MNEAIIRTPEQVEEAASLLKRWKAFGYTLSLNETWRIREAIAEPLKEIFGRYLPDRDLRHVQESAAAAAKERIREKRNEAREGLLALGVNPEPEEVKP